MNLDRRQFLKGSIATVLSTLILPNTDLILPPSVRENAKLIKEIGFKKGGTMNIPTDLFQDANWREYYAKYLIRSAQIVLPPKTRIALLKGDEIMDITLNDRREQMLGDEPTVYIPYHWYTNADIINGKIKPNDKIEIYTL